MGDETLQASGERERARRKLVEAAAKRWIADLVDLTGRNNLLYYRDLKRGTLSLDDVPVRLIFSALQGKTIRLSQFFRDPDKREDAVRRTRAVHAKAKENFEERGLETLYLACGMATWTAQKSAAKPNAPVLLVPVSLRPKGGAQEEFELSVPGDLEVNPTFLQMLKVEFNVECDPAELLAHSGIEGRIDTPEELETAYRWLTKRCRSVPGFDITERFVVGNFSYVRMPMVRDLETSIDAMARHDIVSALAGDAEAQKAIRKAGADADIPDPDDVPPADEFLVLDADSSQNRAINEVLAGRNLIIKGPPGTGKSQTITNLISALVARGKRVLFVAEKRAAIDAVLRRLTDVGLDDLVLDLHGGVASKRETARAISRVLEKNAQLAKPSLDPLHRQLVERRDQLNRRAKALHRKRNPWEISFFEVQSRLIGLPQSAASPVRFRGRELQRLSENRVLEIQEELQHFVGLGGLTVRHSDAPWGRAKITSGEEALAAQDEVQRIRQELPAVATELRQAAELSGMRAPEAFADWGERFELWREIEDLRETFTEEIFALDLDATIESMEPATRSVATRLSAAVFYGEYRAARKRIRSTVKEGLKLPAPDLASGVRAARTLLDRWRILGGSADRAPNSPPNRAELEERFIELRERLHQIALKVDRGPIHGSDSDIAAHLDRLLADISTLSKLPEIHRLEHSLRDAGMADLLDHLDGLPVNAHEACEVLQHAWLTSLREHMQLNDPLLGAFDGDQHREVVREFQVADRGHIETTPQRVRRLCAEQAVAAQDADPKGAALVKAEAAKKVRHKPIRQVFASAPTVMTALKPCWVMSPLVVSQVLPSDRPYFDVVVFDEASQVRPAEAIPAVLRGKQLIVAGDERQLPPTSFFAGSNLDVDEEEAELEANLAATSAYESILEALQPFVGFRMLEWHYRSRDERLIAFSNAFLYDRRLTTFPGVKGPDCVRHVLVTPEGEYDGDRDSSSAEVRKVVDLVIEHAETQPERSLGVIAMGIKHADRIEAALREALHGRDDLNEFFHEDRPEPFFVKNLERVQGDERDAIILSIGYGKDPATGRLLYNQFGPLTHQGGERRLNVAVTRAKEQMTLVSSFTHHDMDPARSSAKGIELLRAYLEYCASKGSNLPQIAGDVPELNPFEADVRDSLEAEGIQVVPQFGVSGYRIDFAAKHPSQPGRMVLAIECDGATYHSTPSARDRDRLRQEHLERLGWRFHRIWSQDWFYNKAAELERVKASYEEAVKAADGGEVEVGGASAPTAANESVTRLLAELTDSGSQGVRRGPRPIRTARPSIDSYSHAELVQLIQWIESDTLPRTRSALLEEAIRELGFKRRGKKIIAALDAAIAEVRARGTS